MPEYIDASYFNELARIDPSTVTNKPGCTYNPDKKNYAIKVWGLEHFIDPDKKSITCSDSSMEIHEYFELFIIYYLLKVKNSTPSGEWISEKDLAGGPTFFRGPHLIPTALITGAVGNNLETFKEHCTGRGGKILEMADIAFEFEITPQIPVAVLYWLGDDDFPAEARVLFDRSIEKLLPLDIIFALAYNVCYVLSRS